jgi:hypothetical protein
VYVGFTIPENANDPVCPGVSVRADSVVVPRIDWSAAGSSAITLASVTVVDPRFA